jgi:voltage-gated potassium channel
MYYVENAAQPDVFSDAGKSMWWAVITLTTIGYGDMYPITPML